MGGNTLYDAGRDAFANAGIDWVNDDIKAVLVDLGLYGGQITDAIDNGSGLIRLTITAHGWANSQVISVCNVGGTIEADGVWTIEGATTDTIDLTGSVFSNAYTSGGNAVNTSVDTNLSVIPAGARVATMAASMASKATSAGVVDAADAVFSSVSGNTIEAIVIFKDTGVEATSPLIAFICEAGALPVTPSGADITVVWDNGANKIFKL